jgi:hypothetical protein
MRAEAFLNFFQQSMQQEQDLLLSLWAIASGTYFAKALRPPTAFERDQAGNGQRAVASRA